MKHHGTKALSVSKRFNGFGLEDLKQLPGISTKASWKAGEDIFVEGNPGRDMFIISPGPVGKPRQ